MFRVFSYPIALLPLILALSGPAVSHGQIRAEAVAGQPFGVAQITVPLSGLRPLDPSLFSISEANGRALYPTFQTGGATRRVLGQLLGGGLDNLPPRDVTVSFLFLGDAPLELTLHAPAPLSFVVRPHPAARRADDRLLRQWWRQYHAESQQRAAEGDYPPLVETYLTSMLAQRLRLETPLLQGGLARADDTAGHEALKTLELLAGAESLRFSVLRDTVRQRSDLGQVADQPVPEDVPWPAPPAIPLADEVVIEPIARMVPPECFYVRFGRFTNYLWFNRLTRDYGGDLANMIAGRGLDVQTNAAIEQQLAVRYNELSELMGDQVVAEMAVIGRDTFFQEGAAFGLLFRAHNAYLLHHSLNQERAAVLARERAHGCTQEMVEISGRRVSLLSTPDNRIRSFFAAHENYRLITSSRTIVERFYAMVDGEPSLADAPEFQLARTVRPADQDDTIFIYLSSGFFRGLVSPQYQIELERRMKSAADLELLQLSRLTARMEGAPHDTIEALIAGGYLPRGFGRRPDGSGPVEAGDTLLDSSRGARGSFTPIPDVALTAVTRDEASRYVERAAFYRDNWRQMDPLMIGIQRFALDEAGLERLVIDANVAPFGEQKYGWITSLLGPPTHERIATAPGDIISVQASVRGGLLSPAVPPHYLFLGIQDNVPVTDFRGGGLLKTLRVMQTTPGYVGAWPKPGFLDWLPLGLAGQPDFAGFSQMPLGLWRRQFDGFSVLSFDKGLLAHVTEFLDPVPAENPAQIRVHVGDLSTSLLSGWVNAMLYERAMGASRGNTTLMHTLSTQLGVPAEQAKATAEGLLNARLICPLGGEYETVVYPGGAVAWHSTAWQAPQAGVAPSAEYRATFLDWFRGMDAELTKEDDRLLVRGAVDMQRLPTEPKPRLPLFNFDLFGGFGGAARPAGDQEAPAAAAPPQVNDRAEPKAQPQPPPRPEPAAPAPPQARSRVPREF